MLWLFANVRFMHLFWQTEHTHTHLHTRTPTPSCYTSVTCIISTSPPASRRSCSSVGQFLGVSYRMEEDPSLVPWQRAEYCGGITGANTAPVEAGWKRVGGRECVTAEEGIYFSLENVVGHLTAEEKEEQETESVLGCALHQLGCVWEQCPPPPPPTP